MICLALIFNYFEFVGVYYFPSNLLTVKDELQLWTRRRARCKAQGKIRPITVYPFYNLSREAEAKAWIEEVVDEKTIGEDFLESLKSGQTLCKLATKLSSSPVKFTTSGMAFKQMENINNFLLCCDKFGTLPRL